MFIIIPLVVLIIIGVPLLVYALFDAAARAKSANQYGLQWFLFWLVLIITIVFFMLVVVMFRSIN